MAKQDRNYIGGSGKMVTFANGSGVLNMYLKKEDLEALKPDKNGFVRLVAGERREPDEYGNTHYVYEDDYVPTKAAGAKSTTTKPQAKKTVQEDDTDDLPF